MATKKILGHKDLKVSDNVELIIGRRCGFNGMTIQNDGSLKQVTKTTVRIGDNLHSGKGCIIRTSDHDFSRGYPMVNGHLAGYATGDVTIGNHVWIGNNVLIMKGVNIGDGTVIQAGSVVVSDIPALSIAGGHPCRVFGHRSEEEYQSWLSLGLWKIKKDEIESRKAYYEEKAADIFLAREQKAINEESKSSLEGALFESNRELKALKRRNIILENQIELARRKVQKMAGKPATRILYPYSLANLTRILEPK